MTQVQQIYIELLKASIWEKATQLDLHIDDLLQITRLAAFQGTGPLVFDQLLKLRDLSIPEALRMQMKQQCMMSIMQQNSMIPLLTQAWKALEEEKIHPVLLKGFGFSVLQICLPKMSFSIEELR